MTNTITQVFYTSKFALQIQSSINGNFFEIAQVLSVKDKTYDWKKKATVKLSISELCNLSNALEVFRIYGENEYIKISQQLFGEKYKNMQFVHKNRLDQTVRTGLNSYNGSLSFIINNSVAGINIMFPILISERLRLERFINKIVDLCLAEPDKFQKDLEEKPKSTAKDNILAFTDNQKVKVLARMKDKLYLSETHSDIEECKRSFLKYCRSNKFEFGFIEIESIFMDFEDNFNKQLLEK